MFLLFFVFVFLRSGGGGTLLCPMQLKEKFFQALPLLFLAFMEQPTKQEKEKIARVFLIKNNGRRYVIVK